MKRINGIVLLGALAVVGTLFQDAAARSRTYHPTLGRFMQRDTLGYIDGMSLYQYVGSNPIVYTDPTGGCSAAQRRMMNAKEDELTTLLKSKCETCDCDHISDCQDDAKNIASAIKNTIQTNYNKGRNIHPTNRGGYICWDWAYGFKNSYDTVNAKHISGGVASARRAQEFRDTRGGTTG